MQQFVPRNIHMYYTRRSLGLDRLTARPIQSTMPPQESARRSLPLSPPALTEEALKKHLAGESTGVGVQQGMLNTHYPSAYTYIQTTITS
ncbi:hypothetical protein EON64_10175 [archaeon]|nr:MAG: hypothetical protein EON64_10175 [archaeon]